MVFGVLIGMLIGQFLLSVKKGASLFALMICVIVAEIGARMHLDPLIVMLAAGIWLRNWSRADASDLLAQLPVRAATGVPRVLRARRHASSTSRRCGRRCFRSRIIAVDARRQLLRRREDRVQAASGAEDVVKKYAWFGLVPQAGLALALALVLKNTFPSFGDGAAVILFGVVGFNECIAPIVLRVMLMRSGEAGKKQGVDFAAGGH